MSYNKEKDVSAGYISPEHQIKLIKLKEANKRKKRAQLEVLIDEAYKKLNK